MSVMSHAENEPYRLSPGEYGLGIRVAFLEDVTGLYGNLFYGISNNLHGYLAAGMGYPDQDELLPGTSMPPFPTFGFGFATSDTLDGTGLDYHTTFGFGIGFGKIIDDNTDKILLTIRTTGPSGGVAFSTKIPLGSDISIVPLAGLSYVHAWTRIESDIIDFTETETDSTWSGYMGLTAQLSPAISIGGSVEFSLEESDITYTLSALFRPGGERTGDAR